MEYDSILDNGVWSSVPSRVAEAWKVSHTQDQMIERLGFHIHPVVELGDHPYGHSLAIYHAKYQLDPPNPYSELFQFTNYDYTQSYFTITPRDYIEVFNMLVGNLKDVLWLQKEWGRQEEVYLAAKREHVRWQQARELVGNGTPTQ